MITKRTSVTAAVCGVALVASLTACSTGPSSGSAEGELTVLSLMTKGTSSGDVFYAQVKKFEEESGVKVKVIDASQDIDQVFETSVAADSQADIIAVNLFDKTTSWIENGITLDVSDYAADWGVEDGWVPEAVSDWTTPDGQLRGFPYAGFSWPILYNTTLLKQAGVDGIPQTTDELIAAADKLRAAGITPWVNGGSDWNGAKLFSQFIQLYTDEDETKTLQSEGGYCASDDAMKGIDTFIEVRDGGVFVDNIQGYTVDMAQSDYFEGKAAIMSNASWMFSEIPDEVLEGTELGGLPLPDGAAGDKPTIFQAYTGTGFMLSTKAESKIDDVEKFVKFFNEPATAEPFVSDASSVLALADPAVSNAATNKLLKAAQSTLLDETQIAVLPDLQVPSAASANVDKAAAQAFGPGVDAQTICGVLDAAYQG